MSNDPSAGIAAIVVVLLLGLVLRWVFRPARRQRASVPVDASASASLGLLTVIDTNLSRQDALKHRAVLGESGIRSSMSRRRDGAFDVLVFHGDADSARMLLGS